MDDKEMLRFAAKQGIPPEDLPSELKFEWCKKQLLESNNTEFEVSFAEANQKALQAKFLRASGADVADVICWRNGMDAGAPFAPGC